MNNDDAYKRMAEKQQESHTELIKAAAKDSNMCDNPRLAHVPKELEHIFKKGVKREHWSCGTQNGVFEVGFGMEIASKYMLDYSATIPPQFPYMKHTFSKKCQQN